MSEKNSISIIRKKKITLFDAVNTLFVLLIVIITLYPMYFTVIASVSEPLALGAKEVIWKPVGFTLEAYQNLMQYDEIWRGYGNSIYYTVAGTLFSLFLTIPAAYTLSKKELPARGFLMTMFLIVMYFGGGMVPTYLLVKNLGLLNTRLILILMSGVSVYNVIVTRVFFASSIPDTLYEAAEIDGAGEFKKFVAIAMPLAKPIIAVMCLYYAVGMWNSYFSALLYVSSEELHPLQMVLRKVLILNANIAGEIESMLYTPEQLLEKLRQQEMATTMRYAMVFIASAPMLIIYPFIQKHFVKGVMIGALKG